MSPELLAILKPIALYLLRLIVAQESGKSVSPQEMQTAFDKAVEEGDSYHVEKLLSPDREHPSR